MEFCGIVIMKTWGSLVSTGCKLLRISVKKITEEKKEVFEQSFIHVIMDIPKFADALPA